MPAHYCISNPCPICNPQLFPAREPIEITPIINWIDLNLPYDYRSDYSDSPKLPDISSKEIEKFGKSLIQYRSEISDKYFEEFSSIEKSLYHNGSNSNINNVTSYVKDSLESIRSTNLSVDKVLSYREFIKEYNYWLESLPEIIQWDIDRNNYYEAKKENDSKKSFCGLGLNQPGTLIEIEDNGIYNQYLIGDINLSGGVCNDCTAFSISCIVKRYAVIWRK